MANPHQRIWSHWNVTPWRDSRNCSSPKVCLSWRMCAALTAWCERTCCWLSCLRGRRLSISWTCWELPPLCFRYGRHVHLVPPEAALFMLMWLQLNVEKGKNTAWLNICPARFPWQRILMLPLRLEEARTPLRNPQEAKKQTTWVFASNSPALVHVNDDGVKHRNSTQGVKT